MLHKSLVEQLDHILPVNILTMSVTLPTLPYAYNALEPYIGQKTVEIHHDKHPAKYVANTNALIAGTDLENADLVTIIRGMQYNINRMV